MATIIGTPGDDSLLGTTGNDTIDGLAGADTMTGRQGNDLYRVDNSNDVVIEALNQGRDTVRTTLQNYSLPNNVEDLIMAGAAHPAAVVAFGNFLNNSITLESGDPDVEHQLFGLSGNDIIRTTGGLRLFADGGDGNDSLFGSTRADSLFGGEGNDNIDGGDGNDNLFGNQGDDHLRGQGGHDLLNGGEGNDRLNGSTGNDVLIGDIGNDRLMGFAGSDTLNGGEGADRMEGGEQDDVYAVDNAQDVLIEATGPNGGRDEVFSSVSYTLAANLEALTLTGGANLSGTGNNLANWLFGNSGDNLLRGLGNGDILDGMEGNDTLEGGDGDDLLIGGSGNDLLNGGNGNDTLITGNDGFDNDTVNGGAGNDNLHGFTGNNILAGGTGNDSYFLNYADFNNQVVELAGQGIDTIYTLDWSRTLDPNIENLVIRVTQDATASPLVGTGTTGDNRLEAIKLSHLDIDADIILYGEEGNDEVISLEFGGWLTGDPGNDILRAGGTDDFLLGGSGNDQLHGGGGMDELYGGEGSDDFYFSTFAGGVAKIFDFNGNQDELKIADDLLADLDDVGGLAANRFHAGASATTATQRLIYDATAGALYYDADGNGAAGQQLILNIVVTDGTFNHNDIDIVAA